MTLLPPWNANEKWEYGADASGKRWARVTGRKRAPDVLRRNVFWWFQNDYEESVDEATWYHPEWPQWKRALYWNYFRNPMQNARLFIWGWADRNYTVTVIEGNPDPMVVQRDDVGEQGYQRALLTSEDGEQRTFVSYCDNRIVWYKGTQPSGIYGAKILLK